MAREKLKVLDLFSGIGGFSLGLERAGMQTVAFCEIELFCQKVLKKHWPDVPIFEDVRKLKGSDVGPVDLVCGGYPCQPFSLAGKRAGAEDDRHLWPEVRRLLSETGAHWFIGENVAGHISMGLDEVLSDLESLGYTCQAFVIPAVAVNAEHQRDRVWIVANSDKMWELQPQRIEQKQRRRAGDGPETDATHLDQARCQGGVQTRTNEWDVGGVGSRVRPSIHNAPSISREYWNHKPVLGRGVHGVSHRLDRIGALGNAVVPQIPDMIGRAIIEVEEMYSYGA